MNNPTMRAANADAVREIVRDIVRSFSAGSRIPNHNPEFRFESWVRLAADYTSARRTHEESCRTYCAVDYGHCTGVGAGECREYRGSRAAHAYRGDAEAQGRVDVDSHRSRR